MKALKTSSSVRIVRNVNASYARLSPPAYQSTPSIHMKEKKKKTIEQLTAKGYYYVNRDITDTNFPVPSEVETEGYKITKEKIVIEEY